MFIGMDMEVVGDIECVVCRCDHDPGVAGGAWHGLVGPGVRSVGAARLALFPDPAHGAHGPTRWHLETARLCRLCTSTGQH